MRAASGRPWRDVGAKGAVGDGVTDYTAAFTACLTQILITKGYGAGIIYVPPSASVYCLFSGITISSGTTVHGIILMGSSVAGTLLSACRHNTVVVTLNDQWAQVRQMTVYGFGSFHPIRFSPRRPQASPQS